MLFMSSSSSSSELSLPSSIGPHSLRSVTSESGISRPYSGLGSSRDTQQLLWLSYLTIFQKQWVKSNSTGRNESLWYTKYPCSSPSGIYIAALRYFSGTLCSPLWFNSIPVLKTFSALDAVVRFDLMSRYNGSWLDPTWDVLGLSSWRRGRYRSFCFDSLARLVRWLSSLFQTTLRCSSLSQSGDKYLG